MSMDSALFGFTIREVAFMRSLSESDLHEWLTTLREIRALPTMPFGELFGWL